MDVSFYISELLTKHGEISVPGLGYLVKAYMPGYYNDSDGKFYPPHYLVQFDPQTLDDDDTLTQYIADVKNISLESSKYFTDKFITEIRENALVKEVAVADLGWFYTEQGRLLFKPASAVSNDPAFFGYTPVSLVRIGAAPVQPPQPTAVDAPESTPLPPIDDFTQNTTPPVFEAKQDPPPPAETNTPVIPPVSEVNRKQALIDEFNARNKAAIAEEQAAAQQYRPAEPQQQYVAPQEEQYEEEEEERRRPRGLMIFFGVILVLALAFLGVYKFAPTRYQAVKVWVQKIINRKSAPVAKTDTSQNKSAEATLPPKVDSATADSIKQARFADSLKQIKTADSLKKAKAIDSVKQSKLTIEAKKAAQKIKTADSLKQVAAAKIARKAKTADSLKQVAAAKIARKAKTADSLKQVRAAKAAQKIKTADSLKQVKAALAAAAKAAKLNKTVVTQPVNVPVKQAPTVVVPDKKVKPVDASIKQRPTSIAAAAATGALKPIEIDPGKTWFAIAKDCTTKADAEATINKLKQLGINGFVVPNRIHPAMIRIATGAYATNDESDAAKKALQAKGFPDAFLTQINPTK